LVSFRRPKIVQEPKKEEQAPQIDEQQPTEQKTENQSEQSTSNSNDATKNQQNVNNNKPNIEITEKTLINECLDSFFKSNITKWNLHHHRAYGIATSLYENNPVTKTTVGDPIGNKFIFFILFINIFLILFDL
jgi:hypothetical protein